MQSGLSGAQMSMISIRDILRWMHGGDKKKNSVFESEQEAYEWCQKAYADSGGITPELRKAYEFYKKNFKDDCTPDSRC